ncbi:MAG: ATP-binding protein [Bilifractor sp.]
MRKKRNHNSFYSFIVRNFVGLAGIVLILAAFFYFLSTQIQPVIATSAGIRKLIGQVDALKNDDYQSLKAGRTLGKNGYFEITDADAKVLYSSRSGEKNTYNSDILQYIPDVDTEAVYSIFPMQNGSEKGWLLVRYNSQNGDEEDSLSGVAVLDENRKFLYSNLDLKSGQLSEDSLNYVYFNEDESGNLIQKYTFKSSSGDPRYLLIHSRAGFAQEKWAQRRNGVILFSAFLLSVLVVIVLAGLKMSKKISKPLLKLSEAIDEAAGGKRVPVQEEQEPKELLSVIRSFNEMESALQKSEEEQRKLREQRRRMVADISHDLKTPVTVIQGYVDAMRDGLIPKDAQENYLQVIDSKTKMIAELINQFSDYSRLDHPEYQLNLEYGDICEYVREYISFRYMELEMAGRELEADIPDQKMYGWFDRFQLKRVFENIIGNALKYSDADAKILIAISRKTIKNEKGEREDWMEIRIGDEGAGIPRELRETVFEPFVVGDTSRTSGNGTGLGLSIAKKIVELHKGKICLMNHVPGTFFLIELPLSGKEQNNP